MEIEIQFFSQQIRNLREARHLTQEELAKELGISRQSVIAFERGRCLPSLPLALNLANVFDLELENIFLPENNQNINKTDARKEVKPMANDLMPFSPMREITHLHNTIDRLFDDAWSSPDKVLSLPTINVYEKGSQVIVKADVPGVKEEDLSIEVGEDYLMLKGERKTEEEIEEKNFFRKEVSYGSFARTIGLPAEVNENKAEAELKDGMLTVTLPKKAKINPKVTKIKVKKA